MMIVLANTKGGVGKSTLAVHLAVWIYDQGYSVAFVDADKQRSSSQWLVEAESKIPVQTVDSPDECLEQTQYLQDHHDFVIADGPGGLDDVSRTLLLLADLALFPITPSILDLRSVSQATTILRYAQTINAGRPQGRLILNKIRKREIISCQLIEAAPTLGMLVAEQSIRELQAFRDAAQQGTVVTRMPGRAIEAGSEIEQLFGALVRCPKSSITEHTPGPINGHV